MSTSTKRGGKKSELDLFMRAYVHNLNKKIEWHRNNPIDPHGVGNAVILALEEVKAAARDAHEVIGLVAKKGKL